MFTFIHPYQNNFRNLFDMSVVFTVSFRNTLFTSAGKIPVTFAICISLTFFVSLI